MIVTVIQLICESHTPRPNKGSTNIDDSRYPNISKQFFAHWRSANCTPIYRVIKHRTGRRLVAIGSSPVRGVSDLEKGEF
jgi:hypothetical protein